MSIVENMNFSEIIYLLPVVVILFLVRATHMYFGLYRKKKPVNYPILPGEGAEYIIKNPKNILVFYITPFIMWKMILFERHKDKQLNDAAKKVRQLLLLFIVLTILVVLL